MCIRDSLKTELREEIKRIQRELRTTTIYVTHDQEEAMSIADTIIVMDGGRIRQTGTPTEIYENPVDPLVAGFFGQPAMNIWREPGRILGIRPEDVIISDCEEDGVLGTVTEQYYGLSLIHIWPSYAAVSRSQKSRMILAEPWKISNTRRNMAELLTLCILKMKKYTYP